MNYINLDALPVNKDAIELYRNGTLITDIYNGCTLVRLDLEESELRLKLKIVHAAGKQKVGTEFFISFSGVDINKVTLQGEPLDDLGLLKSICVINTLLGIVELTIASSICLNFNCNDMSLIGI